MLVCENPKPIFRLPDGSVHIGAPPRGHAGQRFFVGCGKCDMCLLRRSRDMAVRAVHEARLHPPEASHFVTTTYADAFLPEGGVLVLRHCQLFMKKLRLAVSPCRVRYMLRGEYGERNGRPHYHWLLFGLVLNDLKLYGGRRGESDAVYTSAWLESLWGMGSVKVAPVNSATAQYTASYLDKLTASPFDDAALNPATGELVARPPAFNRYSTRPGLGAGYVERFGSELWAHDSIIVDGRVTGLPRYYSKLLERQDPERFASVKARRETLALSPEARRKSRPYHVKARAALIRQRIRMGSPGRGIV